MNKKARLVSLIALFIFSRLLFIQPQAVFFDGPEYLHRLQMNNLFKTLTTGHAPFHAGYFLFTWPIYQLARISKIHPLITLKTTTAILSLITLALFYKTVKNWLGKKIAFLAAIILSLIPIFWITNISLLVESIYPLFFWLSLYCWQKYLRQKKNPHLFLSSLSFLLAYLTHKVVLIWLPLYLIEVLINQKKSRRKLIFGLVSLSVIITAGILIDSWLTWHAHLWSWKESLLFSLSGRLNEHSLTLDFYGLLRFIRNFLILTLRNNTNLLCLFSLFGLYQLWHQKPRLAKGFLLALLPLLATSQWWDVVLAGRHALLASFILAILAAYYLQNKKAVKLLFLIITFLVSLGGLILLAQPIPYSIQAQAVKKLNPEGLLIETHYARPFINYAGKTILVNEPGWLEKNLDQKVNNYLKQNRPVYVTNSALDDPCWFYNGPWLHPLYKGRGQPTLNWLEKKYVLIVENSTSPEKRSIIYKVTAKNGQTNRRLKSYPNFPRERLDYTDPISFLWHQLNPGKRSKD